jgi:hypothetical protein
MRKPRGAEERSGRRRAAPTRATAAGAKASEGAMAEMATTAARNARENMLGSSVALDTTTTLKAFVCVLSVTWAYILSVRGGFFARGLEGGHDFFRRRLSH